MKTFLNALLAFSLCLLGAAIALLLVTILSDDATTPEQMTVGIEICKGELEYMKSDKFVCKNGMEGRLTQ